MSTALDRQQPAALSRSASDFDDVVDPRQGCTFLPGSPEKIEVLAARFALELPLFDPQDDPGDYARVPVFSDGNFKLVGWQTVNESASSGEVQAAKLRGRQMAGGKRVKRVEEFFRRLHLDGEPLFSIEADGCWLAEPAVDRRIDRTGLTVQQLSAWVFCQVNRHNWVDFDRRAPTPIYTTCGQPRCFHPRHLEGKFRLRVLFLAVKRFLELAGAGAAEPAGKKEAETSGEKPMKGASQPQAANPDHPWLRGRGRRKTTSAAEDDQC